MPGRLAEKVALVTGGATGIGRAVVKLFAREGAQVTFLDTNIEEAEATQAWALADGSHVSFIACDVADGPQVHAAVAEVVNRYGRLDVVHANAGIELVKKLADTTAEEWQKVLAVNVGGVYQVVHAALPTMRRQHGGAVVITASPHALATYPGMTAYAASKGAVLSLARALALDHASEGIRVNAILPGAVDTPMLRREAATYADPEEAMRTFSALQPIGRMGQPDEIAPAVLFLASDEASFITGAYLAVDGGALARL